MDKLILHQSSYTFQQIEIYVHTGNLPACVNEIYVHIHTGTLPACVQMYIVIYVYAYLRTGKS